MMVEPGFARLGLVPVLTPAGHGDQRDAATQGAVRAPAARPRSRSVPACRCPAAPRRAARARASPAPAARRRRASLRGRPSAAAPRDSPRRRDCRPRSAPAGWRAAGRAARSRAGSIARRRRSRAGGTMNSLPSPTPPLRASSVPPCSSTRPLASASPIPRPPSERSCVDCHLREHREHAGDVLRRECRCRCR